MNPGDRYVLLGLARPRATWFGEVSRWATAATIPAEFVKCVSAEELRARLASGRRWSAALLDGGLSVVDRDLVAAVRDAGCAALVVDDRGDPDRWRAIGAAGVLPATLDRAQLLDLLDGVAVAVGQPAAVDLEPGSSATPRGVVIAVCGAGGVGTSSAAAALAEGIAASGRDVLLADLATHAEQAVLHDVRDVVPGIQELVEAHRNGVPTSDEVRRLTFSIVERGYALLLGLRRARYWPSLRPRAFAAAFTSLAGAYDAVVCDVTADFEGEGDAGSVDVEERNVAARTAMRHADVVVIAGRPGVKGVHALVRVLTDVTATGVPVERVLPVIVASPRSPRARAEIASAVADLARPATAGRPVASPVFLPNRPVEQAFRDGTRLPSPLPARLAGAVDGLLALTGRRIATTDELVAVVPGTLGSLD